MNLCHACSCELIHWLRDFHFVFITINSLINPFLYAFRLPNFKSAVKRILCCSSGVAPLQPPNNTARTAASRTHTTTASRGNPSGAPGISQREVQAWENRMDTTTRNTSVEISVAN